MITIKFVLDICLFYKTFLRTHYLQEAPHECETFIYKTNRKVTVTKHEVMSLTEL